MNSSDEEFLRELRDEFLEGTDVIESILTMIPLLINQQEKFSEILSKVHEIKGNAQSVGMSKLVEYLHHIESYIHILNTDKCENQIIMQKWIEKFAGFFSILKDHFEDLKSVDLSNLGESTILSQILGEMNELNEGTAGDDNGRDENQSLESSPLNIDSPSTESPSIPAFKGKGFEIFSDDEIGENAVQSDTDASSIPAFKGKGFEIFSDDEIGENAVQSDTDASSIPAFKGEGFEIFSDDEIGENAVNAVQDDASNCNSDSSDISQSNDNKETDESRKISKKCKSSTNREDGAIRYLICSYNEQRYAIRVNNIQEILENKRTQKLPFEKQGILGVVSLRGRVIPVLDLEPYLGAGEVDNKCMIIYESGLKIVGLNMQEASQVVEIEVSNFQKASISDDEEKEHIVNYVSKVNGDTVLLLDVEKLLVG